VHSLAEPHSGDQRRCLLKKPLTAQRLSEQDEPEVRQFLIEYPLQTFGLLGLINDNGLVSPHNRGDFYAYRGDNNELEGVALIGYNTVIDARSEEAIQVFADLAKAVVDPFLILAQESQIDRFMEYYADALYRCTAIDRYYLFRHGGVSNNHNPLPDVRLATINDLEQVAWAHNQCGLEETEVDGLALDAEGFTARCARRIERGRTWIWSVDNQIVLKMDVITSTPEIAYLESLWVHPDERGKGYGPRFLNQVGEHLLKQSAYVCLLAQENNSVANRVYVRAGYEVVDSYRAMFCNKAVRS
jgi:GNAT superfamily N-acetyltransferase